jgi:hypothetical protein
MSAAAAAPPTTAFSAPHSLQPKSFNLPAHCAACNGFIWCAGGGRQEEAFFIIVAFFLR